MAQTPLVLTWNKHKKTIQKTLTKFHEKTKYSDVILICEDQFLYAHKVILSACSEYFENIFEKADCKCPVIVLNHMKISHLECLLNYMYKGESEIKQDELTDLVTAAISLKIKGLASAEKPSEPISNKRNIYCLNKEDKATNRKKSKTSSLPKKQKEHSNEAIANIEEQEKFSKQTSIVGDISLPTIVSCQSVQSEISDASPPHSASNFEVFSSPMTSQNLSFGSEINSSLHIPQDSVKEYREVIEKKEDEGDIEIIEERCPSRDEIFEETTPSRDEIFEERCSSRVEVFEERYQSSIELFDTVENLSQLIGANYIENCSPSLSVEPWPGKYDFNLIFNEENAAGKLGFKAFYSSIVNCIFLSRNTVVPVGICLSDFSDVSIVNAILLYKDASVNREPVLRCHNHRFIDMEAGHVNFDHMLQTEDTNAYYRKIDSRFCFDLPVKINPGESYFKINLKLNCWNACATNVRRFICILFTVFSKAGEEIGRQMVNIKCCESPFRDKAAAERKVVKQHLINMSRENNSTLGTDCTISNILQP